MSSNLIMWNKPKKIRSTKEHNEMFSSDCGVPGTYVSNMSAEDERTWKGKIIKRGEDFQIEVRKLHGGSNVLFIIGNRGYKHGGIHYYKDTPPGFPTNFNPTIRFSTNGPLQGGLKVMVELDRVIEEARTALYDLCSGVKKREDFTG